MLPESQVVVFAANDDADIVILPVSVPTQRNTPTSEQQQHRKAPGREQKLQQRRKQLLREEQERLAQLRQQRWHYTDPSRKQQQQMEGQSMQSKQRHQNGQMLISMAQLHEEQHTGAETANKQAASQRLHAAKSRNKTRKDYAYKHWHVPELRTQASDGSNSDFSGSASETALESGSDTSSGAATAGTFVELSQPSIGRTIGNDVPSYTVDSIAIWLGKPDSHPERYQASLLEETEGSTSNGAAEKQGATEGGSRLAGNSEAEGAAPGGATCVCSTQQHITSTALDCLVDGSNRSSLSQRSGDIGHADAGGGQREDNECGQQLEGAYMEGAHARTRCVGGTIEEVWGIEDQCSELSRQISGTIGKPSCPVSNL